MEFGNNLNAKKLKRKYDLNLLGELLNFCDVYEINIQFWPHQTAVFIAKDGVDLQDYGGDFEFAVQSSIDYLKRINKLK